MAAQDAPVPPPVAPETAARASCASPCVPTAALLPSALAATNGSGAPPPNDLRAAARATRTSSRRDVPKISCAVVTNLLRQEIVILLARLSCE
eukprot:4451974-Pleurochrysis_carterae.AAC.1